MIEPCRSASVHSGIDCGEHGESNAYGVRDCWWNFVDGDLRDGAAHVGGVEAQLCADVYSAVGCGITSQHVGRRQQERLYGRTRTPDPADRFCRSGCTRGADRVEVALIG